MVKNKKNKKNAVSFKLVHRKRDDPKLGTIVERIFVPQQDYDKSKLSNSLSKVLDTLSYGIVTDKETSEKIKKQKEEEQKLIDKKMKELDMKSYDEFDEEIVEEEVVVDEDIMKALQGESDYSNMDEDVANDFFSKIVGKEKENEENKKNQKHEELNKKEMEKEKIERLNNTEDVYKKELNQQFDKVLEDYDDDNIGELDDDEVLGILTQNDIREDDINAIVDEDNLYDSEFNYKPKNENGYVTYYGKYEKKTKISKNELAERILKLVEVRKEEEKKGVNQFEKIKIEKKEEQWDCESIVSTYSNLENHPNLIKDTSERTLKKNKKKKKLIELSKKSGIPLNVLPKQKEKSEKVKKNVHLVRKKDESKEEKRKRKKELKKMKKEKRKQKKALKKMFKSEETRMGKIKAIPTQRIRVKYH